MLSVRSFYQEFVLLLGIWFLARPPILSAARVKENCFSLPFITARILPDLAEGVNSIELWSARS
jgi:hypothetical protein